MASHTDHSPHMQTHEREKPMASTDARQGNYGRPVLIVLLAALVMAMLIWVPVEWWGQSQAPDEGNAVNQAYPESTVGSQSGN